MSAKSKCLEAFEKRNKQDAERLLPQIQQPADIRTTIPGMILKVTGMILEVTLLHLAAKNGWIPIIFDLITKYKCDTNCRDSCGHTPLHYAVIRNHLEVVRYLINEQHCDPMTRNNCGDTPLHKACRYGYINIVQYLINEQHCDPMTRNNCGDTPLHKACRYGYFNIVKYLINKQHCDPMTRNNCGNTPLHEACRYGHINIVQYLINERHCDPMTRNNCGNTPLHEACRYGHINIVQYLINEQHCDPMTRDNDGNTPLHIACQHYKVNIVQYLVEKKYCNPSCTNRNGDTPLHLACCYNHDNYLVEYLLSKCQVNPLAKNIKGQTPMYTNNHNPLLRLAARYDWMKIIIDLITKYKCDTNFKDLNGYGCTPLHYGVHYNHLEVVRYFINERHCDPMIRDNDGNTPLHIACRYGHFNIVQCFVNKRHCNPMTRDNDGNTPLHIACRYGHFNIVQYFVNGQHCDPMTRDNDGNTPLHIACRYGHFNIVQYFINGQHCDPMTGDNDGNTPLHIACNNGKADIVGHLLSTGKVNPLAKNKYYNIPMYNDNGNRLPMLHLAAAHGWMDIITELITKYRCCANHKDSRGCTPLHHASENNHLEVVRYFVNEQLCDPMTKDDNGDTPLHIACSNGNVQTVQYLVFTGKVDPLAKNKYDVTPVEEASRSYNSYNLLKLFESFRQCKRDFPVHTYTKLILTGYSGAGKTTISQLILLLANGTGFFSWLSSGRVTDVECLTAGIISLHVESKVNEVGNMVMYDFAGQQEYYSSHAAVLERIMRNSAAIFVCIVDLSQCMDKISESIHYWMSFIENACSSAQGSSHVIIVGSHADLVRSSQELKEKSSLVESIAERRIKQLTYGGIVSMDCRLSKTKQARHFRSLLSTSQQAILSSQPSMSLYCHVLYAFLRTKLKKTSCTLQGLTLALESAKDYSYRSSLLTESLTSLCDKGLILFVQSQEDPQSSWVVIEKEALLREVNGTLFAPDNFKQYRQVASNTGIVPIATLKKLFPEYSSKMLVSCLENMEFCHPVDLSALQATNLKASVSPPPGARHLFFSSLVKEHRPGDLPSPRFGWCLGCSDPHQFFSNRFLHVLLLRLAFTFPLGSKSRSLPPSLDGLERQCKVWRNGICWKSVSGESTIVEIIDLNRWVIVLVSEKTREAAQTCSSVIRMILDLQHQLCSAVTTCECLISPSLLDRYPFDALPDTDLFDLPTVARAMLLHHKLLLDRYEGINEYSTDEALSCEPYYLLQPSSVCQLFNQSMASQPVPDPLLQEVLRYCHLLHQKPRDHKELRECVNKHSIFSGRNPLVSCSGRLYCSM